MNKLTLLREKLSHYELDGFIIPSNDEFQSEYVPDNANPTGFVPVAGSPLAPQVPFLAK